MADDLDSRLKAWEARMAIKKVEERDRVEEPIPPPRNARDVTLGAATNFLVFPPGFERQYDQHLALTRALKMAGVYPKLKVYGLAAQPQPSGTAAPRLLAITGSAADTERLPEVFYSREAEAFVAQQLGGDWNAINPAASIANLADPGGSIDRRSFDAVMTEIRAGRYYVTVELP